MHSETPQTTLSLFDRRMQLRLLSFFGSICVIAVMLSMVNSRFPTDRKTSRQQNANLDDSLDYEANREPLSDEFDEEVTLTGFEATGQDRKSRDQGLFKSRSQERGDDGELFSRRGKSVPNRDNASRVPDSAFDAQPTAAKGGTSRSGAPSKKDRYTVSPDSFENVDFANAPRDDKSSRRRVDAGWSETPPRGNPLSFEGSSNDDRSRQPFVDSNSPVRSSSPRKRESEMPSYSDEAFDDETNQDTTSPWKRRSRAEKDDEGLAEDFPNSDPLDSDQKKDPWISDPYDQEPFRADSASVRIDKGYLDLVRDNEVGIRRDEAEVYYWLLDHVRTVSSTKLENAGLRDVQYVNLMTEPNRYRGEPITIEGDLWRLEEYDAGRNEFGVSRVYVGWVFTGDSGNHPYRIVCTSLGRGIELGTNLRKPVRFTGYFFKREGYQSNGGVQIAPTLLASRIVVNPSPNGIPLMAGILPHMLGGIMAVGLALLVTVMAFAIGDERSMQAGLNRLHHHPQVSFATLGIPTGISVEESLREFAEQERLSAVSGAYGPLLSRQTAREHAVHDYAASRQMLVHEGQVQHRRQTNVLQRWVTRQKQNLADIQALRGRKSTSTEASSVDDELTSDKLSPARHVLPKSTSSDEVDSNPFELSATAQIERDRLVREKRIRDQIHHQQAEAERLRLQRVAQERADQERAEFERLKREQLERDRIAQERHSFDRADHVNESHGSSHSMLTVSERLEQERLQRERLERERVIRERIDHDRRERELRDAELRERERLARERADVQSSTHQQYSFTTSHEHERLERERLERDRRERERLEFELLERERLERERIERERLERERYETERRDRERLENEARHRSAGYARAEEGQEEYADEFLDDSAAGESESTESDHSRKSKRRRGGGWGWPQRRKRVERNDALSDLSQQDRSAESTSDSNDGESRKKSGKRRGGWGWPKRRKNGEIGDDASDTDESLS